MNSGGKLGLVVPDQHHQAYSLPTGKVDGQLVYAIGDIHGCYDQLVHLLDKIARDAERHALGRVANLVFCGDYVDRGPATSNVLDALCWLKRHGPFYSHFLQGNHEEVMLAYLRQPEETGVWLKFGGDETLRSYGVMPPDAEDDADSHRRARDDLLEQMPAAHLRFLQELQLMFAVGDFAFVHAGVRQGVPLAHQSAQDMLWIREDFVDVEAPFERIIVHGHSWVSETPVLRANRIGIDTGVYKTGVLSAVRIEDDGVEILSSR